jgi:hypothetical protein
MNCCTLEIPIQSKSSLYTLFKSNGNNTINLTNAGVKHGSYERRLSKIRVFKLSSKYKVPHSSCVV